MQSLTLLDKAEPAPARSDITDQEAAALARATVGLFARWGLGDAQAATLLGGISARSWARWKAGEPGRIPRDLRTRMSNLLGIHKALRILFRDPERGYAWIRQPNSAFAGSSALDVMLRGELTDIIRVRSYLDAERGGW